MTGSTTFVAGVSPAVSERTTMAAAVISGPRTIDVRLVPMPAPELLTHSYRLEDLSLAMRDMEERPDGFMKGWIRYD